MANKAIDKHYLLESLKDFYTTILLTFFQKKLTVTTVPDDPENGDVIIYVGATSGDFVQGHTYKYNLLSDEWADITPAGSGGGTWGTITGTLSDQTDLQTVLDKKASAVELSIRDYNDLSLVDKRDPSKVYFTADKYYAHTVTWNGLTSFDGDDIWTDGTNIYYSNTDDNVNKQYKLNGDTWEVMTWEGYSYVEGHHIWTDGTNIYYSPGGSAQYKLNGTTWENFVFDTTGELAFVISQYIWTDGTNIYSSSGTSHCVLNGTKWERMTWTGLTDFDGEYVWTDGINIYYSMGNVHYKLNGTNWEPISWSGYPDNYFSGKNIWNDGKDCYIGYKNGMSPTVQYRLDGTTWVSITWDAPSTEFGGYYIWKVGNDIYYSYNTTHYKLITDNVANSEAIYYKNVSYAKDKDIILSNTFVANDEYVNINISSLDIAHNNYMFKYFSTVEGMGSKNTSYNSSTGVFTIYFKYDAPSSGTFYIEAHKIS